MNFQLIMMRRLFVLIATLVLLVACASSTETPTGCQPSKIQPSPNSFPEIQGDMKSGGEMWALLFFQTAHVKEDEKIVWRITGEGNTFQAQAQSEDGTIIQPIWGPEYHGGSSWQRPGEEWGTGFNFPTPGCWTISVSRGKTTGTISIEILGSQ
jgi:hypothetical protein